MTKAATAEPVTPAVVLVLLAGIERHDPGAPAAIAFRSALARKGREAHAVGGPRALDKLQCEIATTDPDRAEARANILAAAWSGLRRAAR